MGFDDLPYACSKCGAMYREKLGMCLSCGTMYTILPVYYRPASQLCPGPVECESAQDLIRRRVSLVTSDAYPDLPIGEAGIVAWYGRPGQGKSTALLKFLDGLKGPVLFVSLEEGLGTTLISKLQWLEIHRPDFFVVQIRTIEELDAQLSSRAVVAVGIDSLSVSTLRLDDILRLRQSLRVPIMFTLHVTKTGIPAGDMAILHGVDVVIHVEGLKWSVEKTRFGKMTSGDV